VGRGLLGGQELDLGRLEDVPAVCLFGGRGCAMAQRRWEMVFVGAGALEAGGLKRGRRDLAARVDPGLVLPGKDGQEVADPLLAGERVRDGQVGLDRVLVSAAVARA
jgi:hypothetical protein